MTLVFWLRWLSLAATLVVALRLFTLGLHRVYRVFGFYLAFRFCRSAVLAPLAPSSDLYSKIWVLTEPVYWVLHILLVLEIYSLVLAKYRGIYSFGQRLLGAGLAASVTIAALSVVLTPGESRQTTLLYTYDLIGRSVDFSLIVFLLIIVAFLSWFPIPLSRNLMAHSWIYFVFFLLASLSALARTILPFQHFALMNLVVAAGSLACMLAWAMVLSQRGENATVVVRAGSASEDRLLDQLRTFNAALLRSRRK